MNERPSVSIKQVLEYLKSGVTRHPDSPGYNPDLKSIEEIYGLSKKDVSAIFKHEKLKGVRTQLVPVSPYILVDDTEETTTADNEETLVTAPASMEA